MRCAECGHENAEESQGQGTVRVLGDTGWREVLPDWYCAHCAAPISRQRSVRVEPPGGLVDAITRGQAADRKAAVRMPPRRALVIGGVALVILVAIVVAVGLAISASQRRQLTVDQLRPGDCLTGSNMGLGNSNPWPYQVTAVPCTQPHLAEVFFAGNVWPQSLTTYPGNDAINNDADDRCFLAFTVYDGLPPSESSFTYFAFVPGGGSDWASGDRRVVCVTYWPNTPVSYSINGSRR